MENRIELEHIAHITFENGKKMPIRVIRGAGDINELTPLSSDEIAEYNIKEEEIKIYFFERMIRYCNNERCEAGQIPVFSKPYYNIKRE